MKGTVLDEEANKFRIVFYNNNSDVVFITFNGMTGSLESAPFGKNYLLKKGFSVIACFQEKGSDYQFLSFERFKDVVSSVLKNKNVFLYGSSLGGYCSIYYAGAVNGTVIAASPRLTKHPILQKEYKRKNYDANCFKHAELKDLPITNKKIHILHDGTNKADAFFLNGIIRKQIPSNLLEVHKFDYAGHANMIRHLRAAGEFDNFIDAVVKDCEAVNVIISRVKDTDFIYFGKALSYYKNAKANLSKVKDPAILADKSKIALFEKINRELSGEVSGKDENIILISNNKALSDELDRIKSNLFYRLGSALLRSIKKIKRWIIR